MAKYSQLSFNANRANTKTGLEPVIVVEIEFVTGSVLYSDRVIAGTDTSAFKGRLLDISTIDHTNVNQKAANSSTVTLEIGDIADIFLTELNTIKSKLASESVQNVPVSIYQFWAGESWPTTRVLLYSGIMASPVIYDEGKKSFTFDVITPTRRNAVPFAPNPDLITSGVVDAHSSTEKAFHNQPWPLPFGRVVDSPAVLVQQGPRAKTLTNIQGNTTSFEIITDPPGEPNPFPTGTLSLIVGGELVTGSFGTGAARNTFSFDTGGPTANGRNQVLFGITAALRPTALTDPDTVRADVLYINSTLNSNGVNVIPLIAGYWITGTLSGTTAQLLFCIKQVGNKCFFNTNFVTLGTPTLISAGFGSQVQRFQPLSTTLNHKGGTLVQIQGNRAKRYIVSDNTQTAITDLKRVRAWRQVPIGNLNSNQTTRQLVTVPTGLYEIAFTAAAFKHTLLDGTVRQPMTIKIDPPLSERNEGWEDDVLYCSIATQFDTGSSGSGDTAIFNSRNVARQIKYIIEKYTDLSVGSSFSDSALLSVLDAYPADYTLFQQQDALELCQDIAWQARCALTTTGKVVNIKLLSVSTPQFPDGGIEVDDGNVILDPGCKIIQSNFEDLVTIFVAKYYTSYAYPIEQKIVKRNNVTTLGEKIREYNFFIYQNTALVDASALFWSNRYGRLWQYLAVRGPLPFLVFEPYDFPAITLPNVMGPSHMVGILEEIKHDTFNNLIDLKLWTGIEAGSPSQSQFAWGASPVINTKDFKEKIGFTGAVGDFPTVTSQDTIYSYAASTDGL